MTGTASIPRATYRLQLNRQFTFSDAAKIVPYLKDLGISTCYTSPLLCSQPGSLHGYDITNHKQLDPEIGGEEKFNELIDILKQNNMELLMDIVPNHMGIGHENPWWMEVLEDGQASRYARYFDIDWHSIKKELNGKVLLPILGEHYGKVLEKGEIFPGFETSSGRLSLHYYQHLLPINPSSYPTVLSHRIETLEALLGSNHSAFNEYQSIITAFEHLPVHFTGNHELQEERVRERNITTSRLSKLCIEVPTVDEFIKENLEEFKVTEKESDNIKRLHELLEAQAYRLAYWRVALDEINYRRFFDINTLAALRMEDPVVFSDTHETILELVRKKYISGLRIDHPDGLYDPEAYFSSLQKKAGEVLGEKDQELPLYMVIEKILAPFEHLPPDWQVHGTTGYEFSSVLNGLFIDSKNEKLFNRIYKNFTGHSGDKEAYEKLVHQCKKKIMQTSLASELNVLAHKLNRISEKNLNTRDYTLRQIRDALMDVVSCFPVYRTYISKKGISRKDRDYIEWAVSAAKKSTAIMDISIFDFIKDVLFQELNSIPPEDLLQFTMHFQQYTSPVMAKSVEDTAFYQYNRLVSLNEVGSEPDHFGTSVAAFHYQNQDRLSKFPHSLLATSTHDTKRSEDVRARLNVLSEIPGLWKQTLSRWSRFNRLKKVEIDGKMAPDKNDEYLFYQSLAGIWPADDNPDIEMDEVLLESLGKRLEEYMIKAVREAKVHSNWVNQNTEYEDALVQFIRKAMTPKTTNKFLDEFRRFHNIICVPGLLNSLSSTLLKLTSPGVPDLYQGQEVWSFNLVDPDNRRTVDYSALQGKLQNIQAILDMPSEQKTGALNNLVENIHDGRIKLYVTTATLKTRQELEKLFKYGDYIPLEVTGEQVDKIIAFARTDNENIAIVIATRLNYSLQKVKGLDSTSVILPDNISMNHLENIYSSEILPVENDKLPVNQLLRNFPVALLTTSRKN